MGIMWSTFGSSIQHATIISAMLSMHQQEFQEQDLYCGVFEIPVSVLNVFPLFAAYFMVDLSR
ncbi:expressed unknown protein [Ectocarpus siliculosus]|uniref:Uncharacterized protein n=1 Tax=Ectocarpus siliculosus TaxID=2880 RepID=D8LCW8_ECTSI|nr:expressed unknown protein [Ectocarpus siliculosus]|eukprot:CBN75510.1 expressed unknown protein [Ectocarpus siliculosus]